jgi:hypothetical protein
MDRSAVVREPFREHFIAELCCFAEHRDQILRLEDVLLSSVLVNLQMCGASVPWRIRLARQKGQPTPFGLRCSF